MIAVVMAAGKGVRFRPLTDSVPKVMIRVAGKPFLEHLLSKLEKAGFEETHLVVGYKKEAIEKHFGEKFRKMKLNYFVQEKQLGTAHALSLVEDFVDGKFVALNGDVIVSTETLKELSQTDEFDITDGIILTQEVEDTWRYGCLKIQNGKVADIIEKPSPGQEPSKSVSMGIYRFDKLIFSAIRETALSERNEFELVDSIKKLIQAGGIVVPKKHIGPYIHLGDMQDLPAAEKTLPQIQ